MIRKVLRIIASCIFLFAGAAKAALTARVVREGLFIPWELIYGPDDRVWFTQKNGFICRLDPATGVTDTLYHEAATVIRGEGGLTGLALHPSFPQTSYVYAVHNYLNGAAYRIRVMRYTYNGSNALGSPTVLLDGISGSQNHNGSRLLIANSQLYISTGDAENLANPQNLSSINGKILRINLDGTIPGDNPVAGNPVYSWGHRNPQGMVFANGMLYSSEHGPSNDDELNIIRNGRNYGWPAVAGYCDQASEAAFCSDSNVVEPIRAWTPTLAVCGLDYYTGAMFPQFNGSLLLATLKDQHLYQLQLNAARDGISSATVVGGVSFGRLRDICISPAGRIYLSTSNSAAAGTGAFTDKIVELYDPGFTSVPGRVTQELTLFPNPARNTINAAWGQTLSGTYAITDLSGRQLRTGSVSGNSVALDIAELATGVYMLHITAIGSSMAARLFIKSE